MSNRIDPYELGEFLRDALLRRNDVMVKHRCNYCHKVLREDGTCQNPECPRYVPEGDKAEDKDEDENA